MSDSALAAGPELSIYRVAELKPIWWAALEAGCTRLDLSEVAEVDGAGVQLVLALWQASKLHGRPLALVGASDAVQEAFQLVGASQLLSLETEAPHA